MQLGAAAVISSPRGEDRGNYQLWSFDLAQPLTEGTKPSASRLCPVEKSKCLFVKATVLWVSDTYN